MKKLTMLLAFLLTGGVIAAVGSIYSHKELQAATNAAPTVNPLNHNIGLRLKQAGGYRITVCANDGGTLGGTGTVDVYYWSVTKDGPDRWSKNDQLKETVTLSTTCQTFADHAVPASVDGFIEASANGITNSAGGNLDAGLSVITEVWSTN